MNSRAFCSGQEDKIFPPIEIEIVRPSSAFYARFLTWARPCGVQHKQTKKIICFLDKFVTPASHYIYVALEPIEKLTPNSINIYRH